MTGVGEYALILHKQDNRMRRPRIYADTSVFGGCFDDEFATESKLFFESIKSGKFMLVISTTTLGELEKAPDYVQNVLA